MINKNLYNQQNNFTAFFAIIMVLLFLTTFNSTRSEFTSIGFIAILTLSLISFFVVFTRYLVNTKINKFQLHIATLATLILLFMSVGLLNNMGTRGIVAITQFLFVISFFMFSSLINWTDKNITVISNLGLMFLVISPLIFDIDLIGGHIPFFFFISLMKKRNKFLTFALWLSAAYLIFISDARASLIFYAVVILTLFFWKTITKNIKLFKAYFMTAIAAIISFVFLYPNLIYWSKFIYLNDWSIRYTGQRLMSGREILWQNLTQYIVDHPFLGLGTGILPSDILNTTLSSHNSFLHIALQNGFIALFLFFLILYTIWKSYFHTKDNRLTMLSAAFMIGILAYSSFEVVLTQNKMDLALMYWFIFSVGMSQTIKKYESK